MPDVTMSLIVMGRVVEFRTRRFSPADCVQAETIEVIVGKPFPPHKKERVARRVRKLLANDRGGGYITY